MLWFNGCSKLQRLRHSRKCALGTMRSNPSIEGMPKRLRLLCTPHVKR